MKNLKIKIFAIIHSSVDGIKSLAAELGRRAGMSNEPKSDAKRPDGNEKDIKRKSEGIAAAGLKQLNEDLQPYQQEQVELGHQLSPHIFEDPYEDVKTRKIELQIDLSAIITQTAKVFGHWQRRVSALLDEGIDVSTSAVGGYLLVYGCLCGFLIVEALANSFFIGQGSNFGIVGGAIEALFIAAISIVLSFTAGVWIRVIVSGGRVRVALAVLAGLVFAYTLIAYHTLIGWYRGTLVYGNSETAVIDALTNFATFGMKLPDLHCFGLAVVGVFFGGTAFVAGYKSRDAKLAGQHARVLRQAEQAQQRLNENEADYLARVNGIYTDALVEVDKREKAAHEAGRALNLNILQQRKMLMDYEYLVGVVQESYAGAVELYRRSNEAVRSSPVPKYFRENPMPLEIEDHSAVKKNIEAAEKVVASLDELLKSIRRKARDVRSSIRIDYKETLRQAPLMFEAARNGGMNGAPKKSEVAVVTGTEKPAGGPRFDSTCEGREVEAEYAHAS